MNFFVSPSLEKSRLTIYNGPDNEKARWLDLVEFGKQDMGKAHRDQRAKVF